MHKVLEGSFIIIDCRQWIHMSRLRGRIDFGTDSRFAREVGENKTTWRTRKQRKHHIGSSVVISTVAEAILGPFGDRVSNARSSIYAKIAKACRVCLRLGVPLRTECGGGTLSFDGCWRRLSPNGGRRVPYDPACHLSLFRASTCLSA
jgi:hypothetical protein